MGFEFGGIAPAVVIILAKPEVGLEPVAILGDVGQVFTLSVALLGVRSGCSEVFNPVIPAIPVNMVNRHAIGDIAMVKLPDKAMAEVEFLIYAYLPVPSATQRTRHCPWRSLSVSGGVRPPEPRGRSLVVAQQV